ncbi:MAG: hypothetical protein DWQ19_10870 [Crenarchaeota archaeon]|nr:MAG: hypothetical protein DWQ19_10870 [Thermoproteota archaeon]
MTIDNLHHEHFHKRLNTSDNYTNALMQLLKKKKHFKSFRKATREEDLAGIDWWVVFPDEDEESPIQFKLRDKMKDMPLVRYQPFRGTDDETTVEGRDWRGLHDNASKYYYVAIRNGTGFCQAYRITSKKLKKIARKLDKEWSQSEKAFETFPVGFFDSKRVQMWLKKGIWNKCVFRTDDGEIWWKKNRNEGFPKFNMYIPYDYKEWECNFDSKDSEFIKNKVSEADALRSS